MTNDGATILNKMNVFHPAAKMLVGISSAQDVEAGDGTTTATVLAQSIVNEGLKSVSAGFNPMDLKRGIDKAVAAAVETLQDASEPCEDDTAIAQVGTISANGEKEIGTMNFQFALANKFRMCRKFGYHAVDSLPF